MQITTQFSVVQPNKPGMLSRLIDAIADARINLIALTVVDTHEHGVIRLVAENPDALRDVLRHVDSPISETHVITVDLSNRPGALARVVGLLAEAKLNIHYAYVTSGAPGGRTTGILKVNNLNKAVDLLEQDQDRAKKKRRKKNKARGGKKAR